jgi:hypothetical protein
VGRLGICILVGTNLCLFSPPEFIHGLRPLAPDEYLSSGRILQRPDEELAEPSFEQILDILKRNALRLREEHIRPDGHDDAHEPKDEERAVGDVREHDGRDLGNREAEEPVDADGDGHGDRPQVVGCHFACYYPRNGTPSDAVEDSVEVDSDEGDVTCWHDVAPWVNGHVAANPEHHQALANATNNKTVLAPK